MKVEIIEDYAHWNFCDIPLYEVYILESGPMAGNVMIKVSDEDGFSFTDDRSYQMKGHWCVSKAMVVSMSVKRISDDEL